MCLAGYSYLSLVLWVCPFWIAPYLLQAISETVKVILNSNPDLLRLVLSAYLSSVPSVPSSKLLMVTTYFQASNFLSCWSSYMGTICWITSLCSFKSFPKSLLFHDTYKKTLQQLSCWCANSPVYCEDQYHLTVLCTFHLSVCIHSVVSSFGEYFYQLSATPKLTTAHSLTLPLSACQILRVRQCSHLCALVGNWNHAWDRSWALLWGSVLWRVHPLWDLACRE